MPRCARIPAFASAPAARPVRFWTVGACGVKREAGTTVMTRVHGRVFVWAGARVGGALG